MKPFLCDKGKKFKLFWVNFKKKRHFSPLYKFLYLDKLFWKIINVHPPQVGEIERQKIKIGKKMINIMKLMRNKR